MAKFADVQSELVGGTVHFGGEFEHHQHFLAFIYSEIDIGIAYIHNQDHGFHPPSQHTFRGCLFHPFLLIFRKSCAFGLRDNLLDRLFLDQSPVV